MEELAADGRSVISGPFGSDIGSRFFQESGVPVIRGNNLTTDHRKFVDQGFAFLSEEKADDLNAYAVCDDIIFTAAGTIGQVGIIPKDSRYQKYIISNKQLRIRIDPEKADPTFVYYWLASPWIFTAIQNRNTGSTVPLINLGTIRSLPILLPECLEDQRRIARTLGAIDEKIEVNKQINDELEGMARLLYDYWFVQFDFPITATQAATMGKPRLEGKPYRASGGKMVYDKALKREIPCEWVSGNLESLGTIVGGSTPSTEVPDYFSEDGTPWITPKDLSDNSGNRFIHRGASGVTEDGIRAASLKLLPTGTVLMSSRAPIGYLAIAQNPVTTNQGFKSFVPDKGFSSDYIYFTLQHFMKLIQANASGSTFKEISGGTLKAVRVHLPPSDLVASFTESVSCLSSQQSILEQQSRELSDLRDWLLPMLMNGQVTVS